MSTLDIEKNLEAVCAIYQAHPDVHWLEMNAEGKIPARKGWNRDWKKPGFDETVRIIKSGRAVGLVPFSLRAAVIDVDAGDPHVLAAAYPPRAFLPTKRGAHLYYDVVGDPPPNMPHRKIVIGDMEWTVDVIVGGTPDSRKYCKVHGSGLPLLARSLSDKSIYEFPLELFPEIENPTVDAEGQKVSPDKQWVEEIPRTPEGDVDLEKVEENRNRTLFAMCCFKRFPGREMYYKREIKTVDDLFKWARRWNKQFPEPLKDGEFNRTVHSAFKYLGKAPVGRKKFIKTEDEKSAEKAAREAYFLERRLIVQGYQLPCEKTKASKQVWDACLPLEGTAGEVYLREHRRVCSAGSPLPDSMRWLPSPFDAVGEQLETLCAKPPENIAGLLVCNLVGAHGRTMALFVEAIDFAGKLPPGRWQCTLGKPYGAFCPVGARGAPFVIVVEGVVSALAAVELAARDDKLNGIPVIALAVGGIDGMPAFGRVYADMLAKRTVRIWVSNSEAARIAGRALSKTLRAKGVEDAMVDFRRSIPEVENSDCADLLLQTLN